MGIYWIVWEQTDILVLYLMPFLHSVPYPSLTSAHTVSLYSHSKIRTRIGSISILVIIFHRAFLHTVSKTALKLTGQRNLNAVGRNILLLSRWLSNYTYDGYRATSGSEDKLAVNSCFLHLQLLNRMALQSHGLRLWLFIYWGICLVLLSIILLPYNIDKLVYHVCQSKQSFKGSLLLKNRP